MPRTVLLTVPHATNIIGGRCEAHRYCDSSALKAATLLETLLTKKWYSYTNASRRYKSYKNGFKPVTISICIILS